MVEKRRNAELQRIRSNDGSIAGVMEKTGEGVLTADYTNGESKGRSMRVARIMQEMIMYRSPK
jgi:hypothetical protein